MLTPGELVSNVTAHTHAKRVAEKITEAALCISAGDVGAAIEHLQTAAFSAERVCQYFDEKTSRPPNPRDPNDKPLRCDDED